MGTADGDKDPLSAYSRYSNYADRETVEAFEEVAKSSLENVRKNAADWRNGLSGLLAIVTTSAALKTGNDILQYTPPTRILLGLVSLFSILLGGVGLWFLVVAAHGNVKRITIAEVVEAGGMLAWKYQKAAVSKKYLTVGKCLTVISAIFVLVGIGIAWYGPRENPVANAQSNTLEMVSSNPNLGVASGPYLKSLGGWLP